LVDIKNIVAKIKKSKLKSEVEAFIHGAMCLSLSGRCHLSQYSFSKSANRGECLQPCRREFLIKDDQDESEYLVGENYLLSPKDLCTLDFIDKMIEAGIGAFKIEGRIRSSEYTRVVTSAYRKAIDAYFRNKLTKSLKAKLKKELEKVYNRGFSGGFYSGEPDSGISKSLEHTHEKVYVGEIIKFYKKIKVAEVLVRNQSLTKGDQILCLGKNTPASFSVAKDIQINHEFVNKLAKGEKGGLKLPFLVKPKDKLFIWRKKSKSSC
jgi:putative protease